MKNDSVRSSPIELQSFLQSKIDVNLTRCVLMSLPRFIACIVHDAVHSSQSYEDPYDSCPWDPQGIRILSVYGSNFDLQVSIRTDERMQIDCTSDMIHVLEEVALKNHIVL